MSTRTGAVFVGRLHPTKGLEDLIDAWHLVINKIGPCELRIVGGGDGAYKTALHQRISTYGLERCVTFLGRVTDAEKEQVLRSARVFAFPSKEEGWGIVIAEAMAAGVPCVTYDLDVYRGIFTSGRLSARLGDVSAFANQIARLLQDDSTWSELSSQAHQLASTFSWDHIAAIESEAVSTLPRAVNLTSRPNGERRQAST